MVVHGVRGIFVEITLKGTVTGASGGHFEHKRELQWQARLAVVPFIVPLLFVYRTVK